MFYIRHDNNGTNNERLKAVHKYVCAILYESELLPDVFHLKDIICGLSDRKGNMIVHYHPSPLTLVVDGREVEGSEAYDRLLQVYKQAWVDVGYELEENVIMRPISLTYFK